jgi:hypothetical protein
MVAEASALITGEDYQAQTTSMLEARGLTHLSHI